MRTKNRTPEQVEPQDTSAQEQTAQAPVSPVEDTPSTPVDTAPAADPTLDTEVQLTPEAAAPEAAAPAAPLTEEQKEVLRAEYRTKREELLAQLAALDEKYSSYQLHELDTSSVVKPVALVRQLFLAALPADGTMNGVSRSKVIRQAVGKGVAENTAKTQFQVNRQKWLAGDAQLRAAWEELQQSAEA